MCYLVFDFIPGKTLFKILESSEFKIPESTAANITKQLVDALCYCHSKKIAHLDIKPENIMITPSGDAILIDFGLCM